MSSTYVHPPTCTCDACAGLRQRLHCPNCAKEYTPDEIACGFCGTKLLDDNIVEGSEIQVTTEPKVAVESNPHPSPIKTDKPKETKLTIKQITDHQQLVIEKQQQLIEQCQVDIDALLAHIINLENTVFGKYKEAKPWTRQIGYWVAIICGLVTLWILFIWFKSQSGLPPEILNLFKR